MPQTDTGCSLSLSLSAKDPPYCKEQSGLRSALSSASCRRSGRSPALPYPPHECQQSTTPGYPPFPKGTFLLCRSGDISTLH
jgi:hypothetical protein